MASQINIVLRMLRENDCVCGTTFQKLFIPTYAQRVSDLVKKGHIIDRKKCDMGHHSHKGNVYMYGLVTQIVHDVDLLEQQESFF